MALLQRDQVKIQELMDHMVMSMVKLQGRLQFAHKKEADAGTVEDHGLEISIYINIYRM